MAVTPAQVYRKARAYVDALCKLPRSQYAAAPSGHYGRDYNALRKLALEAFPELDERLLGKYVSVRPVAGGREACDASFVEIETYALQIMEQLATSLGEPAVRPGHSAASAHSAMVPAKAYYVEAIRRVHNQAYAPWSAEDDEYLRCRFLEGATIDDLVSEFGRQPGGIRSRLRKLGLDVRGVGTRPVAASGVPSTAAEVVSASPNWRELRPRAGRAWTQDEDQALLREFEEGLPLELIAKSLGRGVLSVEVRLCKLGRIPRGKSQTEPVNGLPYP